MTAENAGKLGKGKFNTAKLLGGPEIDHYHQAVAVVVAETFEQATAAAALIRVEYAPAEGSVRSRGGAERLLLLQGPEQSEKEGPPESRTGDFEQAFAQAPVKLDELYTTPDQSHSMMEPHASIAAWNGDKLTVWTSNQMIDWGRTDLATTMGIPKENVRFDVALHRGRLRLQAVPALGCGNGSAGGEGGRSAGQSRIAAGARFQTTPRTAPPPDSVSGSARARTARITAIAHESGSGDLPTGSRRRRPIRRDCCMPAPID